MQLTMPDTQSKPIHLAADTTAIVDASTHTLINIDVDAAVTSARLLTDGTLELVFSTGAVLLVTGYTPVDPPQLIAPDGAPVHFAHLLAQDAVAMPPMSQQVFVELVPGETQALDFSLMQPSGLRLENGALIITFDNNSEIVLQNYAAALAAHPATAVVFSDGVVLTLAELPETLATVTGLDAIETAAGDAGGAAGRGGFGFQSSFTADSLTGLDPIGTINPTELAYSTQDSRPEPLDFDILDTPIDPLAPEVTVTDERMKEDTTAQLDIAVQPANASQSLTISVSGFTPGWSVDTSLSGGTFDPAAGVWTISLPPGVAFNGGPQVTPPRNSDADLDNLVVSTTVTAAGGATSTYTSPLSIIVDAVADDPTVAIADISDQYWYVKDKGYTVPIKIDTAVTDTDGSEVLSHAMIDLTQPFTMPAGTFTSLASMGVTLNVGTEVSPGIWRIEINAETGDTALAGLAMIVPDDQNYQAIHQSVTGGHGVHIPVTVYSAEVNLNGNEYDMSDNTASTGATEDFRFFITPLVLDLDGDGYDLIARAEGVQFDMTNDGIKDQTSWVGADDGILALDINGDGLINNQSELFGNGPDAPDGFAALGLHDGNGDGVIDAHDAIYDNLLVWRDFNQDGISQQDELMSLAQLGIASIGLATHSGEGQVLLEGSFTYDDGRTGDIADVLFSVEAGTIDYHDVLAASDNLPFAPEEADTVRAAQEPAGGALFTADIPLLPAEAALTPA